jgi:hypothetical protein
LRRAELEAALFHLYFQADASGSWLETNVEGPEQWVNLRASFPTPRDAVEYIFDTFPIAHRKDNEKYGEFRTKRVVIEIYDQMQRAMATGTVYDTLLDPPPADPRVAHPLSPDITALTLVERCAADGSRRRCCAATQCFRSGGGSPCPCAERAA